MSRLPTVIEGTFELPSGRVISVGDASWFRWLESPDARSFRFEGRQGTFSARKETPRTGNFYWTASRRIDTKLHKAYLGHSETLDLDRLEAVAEKLANPEVRERKKPVKVNDSAILATSATVAPVLVLTDNQDFQELQKQVAELQKSVTWLSTELDKALATWLLAHDSERENRRQQLAIEGTGSEQEKELLRRRVAEIAEERDLVDQRCAELEKEHAQLRHKVAELLKDKEFLRQQLESSPVRSDRELLVEGVLAWAHDRLSKAIKLGESLPSAERRLNTPFWHDLKAATSTLIHETNRPPEEVFLEWDARVNGLKNTLKKELAAAQAENVKLASEIQGLQQQLEAARAENAELSRQVAETSKDMKLLKQHKEHLQNELRLAGEEIREAVQIRWQNESLERQVAEVTEARDSLKQQLVAFQSKNEELSRWNASLESETAELAATVNSLDLQNQNLQQQLGAAAAEREALAQVSEVAPATELPPVPDLQELRKQILADLGVGRQAPIYKTVAKALVVFEQGLRKSLSAGPLEQTS